MTNQPHDENRSKITVIRAITGLRYPSSVGGKLGCQYLSEGEHIASFQQTLAEPVALFEAVRVGSGPLFNDTIAGARFGPHGRKHRVFSV